MRIAGISNISFSYGSFKVLDDVSLSIRRGDRTGLIGPNGSGKTTLLNIVSGRVIPDTGSVYLARDISLGMLQQDSGLDMLKSLWDNVMSVFSDLRKTESRMRDLEQAISTEKNSIQRNRLMSEYSKVSEAFEKLGGFELNSRVKGVLCGLRFPQNQWNKNAGSLSGGQKTRLSLARLLLSQPDFLLLDEPTNYIDMSSMEWLEEFLSNYSGTLLVVSHDRRFLDSVATSIIELQQGKAYSYDGNYSTYIKKKAADKMAWEKKYTLQQKELSRLEKIIEQQRRWNRQRNIAAAESRSKAIDRMEKVKKPPGHAQTPRIRFSISKQSGNEVLKVEGVEMAFPGIKLFKDASFTLYRGDRAFIIGPNGSGKTTLLNIVCGRIPPVSGRVMTGHNVQLSFFDQEHKDLSPSNTVLEEVWQELDNLGRTELMNTLALFMFKGEDVKKRIHMLSGGEKSRISLCKMALAGSNLLLLDEPTSHLDIHSREILEEALLDYSGTILAVSHDRYFVSRLATRFFKIGDLSLKDYHGDYESFIKYCKNKTTGDQPDEFPVTNSKNEYMREKRKRARINRLSSKLESLESRIFECEEHMKRLNRQLHSSEFAADHSKIASLFEQKEKQEHLLENLYVEWEQVSSKMNTIQSG